MLAPFAAAQNARAVWDGLDLARQRRVLAALCTVTLHPAGVSRPHPYEVISGSVRKDRCHG